jgi:hypothetical protein
MLSYNKLKDRPRDFLAATGLTSEEFQKLLPAFQAAYDQQYPNELTRAGKPRQRRVGDGAKGMLPRFEDKLLFILVYQKTNPLQTMHALAALGLAPERDARRLPTNPLALEGAPATAIDGTERRRQRPADAQLQKEHYSGKKRTHTDKNIIVVNEMSGKVVYLGPTVAGKTHDKKAAEEAKMGYPPNATLDKDTGFQGYEPEWVLTTQPKKSPQADRGAWATAS